MEKTACMSAGVLTHIQKHTCVCVCACARACVKASRCVVECVVWGQRLVVVLLGVSSTLPVHRGFMQRSACLKNSCQKRQRTQGVFVGVSERSVALEISCSASWGTDISFQRVRNSAVSQNTIVTSQDESLSGLKKTAEYTLQKDCQKLSFCTLLRALYRFPSVWRWSSASVDRSFLDSLMRQENPSEWIFMIQCEVKII